MKKIFFVIAMLAGTLSANAGVFSLSKTNFEGVAGGTVVVPIDLTLDASEDNFYQTVFFSVKYSDTDFKSKNLTAAEERLISGKEYSIDISGAVISIVGKNPTSLVIGQSGAVMYLTVEIPSTAATGSTCTMSFHTAKGAGSDLKTIPFTFDDVATITVVDYVTIDENEEFTPFALTGKDVKLIRSFKANQYYTVVLPFALNNTARKNAWGNDVVAYTLNGCTFEEDDDEMIVKVTLNFSKAGTKTNIAAHTPFLVVPSQDVDDYTFTSVTMTAGTPSKGYADKGTTGSTDDSYGSTINFVGSYAPNTVVPTDGLYLKGGKLYSSQGGTKMKGTRAYFDLSDIYDKLGEYIDVKGFNLDLDGVETSISEIDQDIKAEGWYDLNGRKLTEKPAMKGIYINNGKKVVVK